MRIAAVSFLSLHLSAAPLSLQNTPYAAPDSTATILAFYAPWCPPCRRTLQTLSRSAASHPSLRLITLDIDDPRHLRIARSLGMRETIPYVLVAGPDGNVVKRFEAYPDPRILDPLLDRLEAGRLENGTLPVDRRVDTWKMDRKGM